MSSASLKKLDNYEKGLRAKRRKPRPSCILPILNSFVKDYFNQNKIVFDV